MPKSRARLPSSKRTHLKLHFCIKEEDLKDPSEDYTHEKESLDFPVSHSAKQGDNDEVVSSPSPKKLGECDLHEQACSCKEQTSCQYPLDNIVTHQIVHVGAACNDPGAVQMHPGHHFFLTKS